MLKKKMYVFHWNVIVTALCYCAENSRVCFWNFSFPGSGTYFFWKKASTLQLPGFAAKPACTRCQGHSQEGETSHKHSKW